MVLFVLSSMSVYILFDRYEKSLLARMNAAHPVIWDIKVNSIKVGTVTDADYATMKLSAFQDGRNAGAQLLNLGHVVIGVIGKFVLAVPVTLFWCLIAVAVFFPEMYSSVIAGMQKAGPSDIAAVAKTALTFLTSLVGMAFCLNAVFGVRFGFVNCFSAAVGRMLRHRCNVAAEGDIFLVRQVDGDIQFVDDWDLAWLRSSRGK